jgi:hypothetical protein
VLPRWPRRRSAHESTRSYFHDVCGSRRVRHGASARAPGSCAIERRFAERVHRGRLGPVQSTVCELSHHRGCPAARRRRTFAFHERASGYGWPWRRCDALYELPSRDEFDDPSRTTGWSRLATATRSDSDGVERAQPRRAVPDAFGPIEERQPWAGRIARARQE